MITAKELREQLALVPDDTPIILQKDDEGNGYRYMNGIDFELDGDDANFYDGNENVVRQGEFGEWAEKDDYPELVAVIF